ncbi:N-acetylglucosamine kinase [Actinomadura sp. HBU206391]|uniref:N-acetylglucosamine kinase n=1 Tax=Actinomadura sp. HBU206391 TaxID=2731692 RepID=UPI002905C7E1|nr:BadF/BadG/BcrA/BcrD ATPase family protein [Actinomadura sp. HBU206391]
MITPLLVAIDGGNSKTDVVVVGPDGGVLATFRGGGFRPYEIGEAAAVEVIASAVAAALDRAGAAPGALVTHVAAYLANADLPEEEERLTRALMARGWSRTTRVGNDTFALLRAGASKGWGIAVVCGAGINCLGVGPDGRTSRFPALGPHTGDWGGGMQLGDLALWNAVRGEDGRGPRTALTSAVAAHFDVAAAVDVGLALHSGELGAERLLELTPVLLDVAAGGDTVAVSVVDRLADEVTALGTVALRRLGLLQTPVEVVLGGGVLTARYPLLMTGIERRYAERAPHAELVVSDAPPILGAALLGLDEIGATPETYAALRAALTES